MKALPKTPRALVIGASSGIGAACVAELASRGFRVAAVARRESELQDVCAKAGGAALPFVADVTDFASIPATFAKIVEALSGLDLVIYAAGAMPKIDVDTFDFAKDELVVRTNLLGAMAWLNLAAPHFQRQGHGSIVGISSISGDRGRRGYPAYGASKAGLDTFLESLRNRLSRHGIGVTTIKPGYVDTAMTKGMDKLFWVASPETAAKSIVDAALAGRRLRYVLRRWGLVAFVVRSIPSFLFRRLDF